MHILHFNKKLSALIALVVFLGLPGVGWGQSIWTNQITGTNPNTSNPYGTGDVKNKSELSVKE